MLGQQDMKKDDCKFQLFLEILANLIFTSNPVDILTENFNAFLYFFWLCTVLSWLDWLPNSELLRL